MMMKKIVFFAFTAAAAAAIPHPARQIRSGTDRGIIGVKIAVPEFQPVSADAKTAELTAMFNKVLWDDLDYSGGLSLVSRSLYPLGRFSGPADIKPDDWTIPTVDAQFISFGNIRAGSGKLSVEARLWDLKTNQNREAFG